MLITDSLWLAVVDGTKLKFWHASESKVMGRLMWLTLNQLQREITVALGMRYPRKFKPITDSAYDIYKPSVENSTNNTKPNSEKSQHALLNLTLDNVLKFVASRDSSVDNADATSKEQINTNMNTNIDTDVEIIGDGVTIQLEAQIPAIENPTYNSEDTYPCDHLPINSFDISKDDDIIACVGPNSYEVCFFSTEAALGCFKAHIYKFYLSSFREQEKPFCSNYRGCKKRQTNREPKAKNSSMNR